MKVLHAAYSSDPAAGVARQMAAEQEAADRLCLSWSARFFVPEGTDGAVCVHARSAPENRLAFKREYYRWLDDEMRSFDLLLLRYLRYDPLQLRFLRRLDRPVFLVHHTLEGPQIRQEGGRAAPLKLWLDDRLVRACHARAAGMVSVTAEIAEYQCGRGVSAPVTLLYPNGITYQSLPVDTAADDGAVAELLFVASRFVEWHGLDLLFEAARRSDADFIVHVVGRLTDAQRQTLATDRRFVVHGTLPIDAVEAIASRCTLGLGSFALHRKDMRQGCTLKVREYLLAGLPVFAGHADVFEASARWYRHGACDMEEILRFAEECAGVGRRRVAEDMRPWIDKERLLERLYASLVASTGAAYGETS